MVTGERMADTALDSFLRELRGDALRQVGDGELLDLFVARRDEAAFAALVYRHGPMVLGVCRRVLANAQDVEDAFQATFLVLARKGSTVRPRSRVAAWLHGVAHRTALQARTSIARRHFHERRVQPLTSSEQGPDAVEQELRSLIDQELGRLPEKYRQAVVLCELEGTPRREAAVQLGIPEGTLSSRLAAARKRLARQLARRGLAPSAGALAAVFSSEARAVPQELALATRALGTTGGGTVLPRVTALAEGVIRGMAVMKAKQMLALVFVVGLLGAAGTTYAVLRNKERSGLPKTPPAAALPARARDPEKPARAAKERIAWGDAVGGLRAGLRFETPERPCTYGETVRFTFLVANTSDQPVRFHYVQPTFFLGGDPKITGPMPVTLTVPAFDMPVQKVERTLAAGATMTLGHPYLMLQAPDWEGKCTETTLQAPVGAYEVRYTCDLGLAERLTTGALMLTVEETPPPEKPEGTREDGAKAAPRKEAPDGGKAGEAARREQARFEGKWRLIAIKELLAPDKVAEKIDGDWVTGPGLEAARRHDVRGVTFTFAKDRLKIEATDAAERRRGYVFKQASFVVDPTRTPKAMDLTPLDPGLPAEARRAFGAIYLLDGNELWIADFTGMSGLDETGRLERPRSFDLSVGIAYPLRILVLRRDTEAGKGKKAGPEKSSP